MRGTVILSALRLEMLPDVFSLRATVLVERLQFARIKVYTFDNYYADKTDKFSSLFSNYEGHPKNNESCRISREP